jgi:hypothetical protein
MPMRFGPGSVQVLAQGIAPEEQKCHPIDSRELLEG